MCFYVFLCVCVRVCFLFCPIWFLVPRAWESAQRCGFSFASWSIFSTFVLPAFPFGSVSCQVKRVTGDFHGFAWICMSIAGGWGVASWAERGVRLPAFIRTPEEGGKAEAVWSQRCDCCSLFSVIWLDFWDWFSGWVLGFTSLPDALRISSFFPCTRHGPTCSWWLNDPTLLVSYVSGLSTILPILQRFSAWGRISCLVGVLSTQRFRRVTHPKKLHWLTRWGRPENWCLDVSRIGGYTLHCEQHNMDNGWDSANQAYKCTILMAKNHQKSVLVKDDETWWKILQFNWCTGTSGGPSSRGKLLRIVERHHETSSRVTMLPQKGATMHWSPCHDFKLCWGWNMLESRSLEKSRFRFWNEAKHWKPQKSIVWLAADHSWPTWRSLAVEHQAGSADSREISEKSSCKF